MLSSTQSARNFIRATQVSATNHTHQQGVVTYANNSCAGTGTMVGPTQMGTVDISRSDSDTSLAANWGRFNQITGLTSATIWAKKSETVLCLLGDAPRPCCPPCRTCLRHWQRCPTRPVIPSSRLYPRPDSDPEWLQS